MVIFLHALKVSHTNQINHLAIAKCERHESYTNAPHRPKIVYFFSFIQITDITCRLLMYFKSKHFLWLSLHDNI